MEVRTIFLLFLQLAWTQKVSKEEADANEWLAWYNGEAEVVLYKMAEAQWAYHTNVTENNREVMSRVDAEFSEFRKAQASTATDFLETGVIANKTTLRLLKKISALGINLTDWEVRRLSNLRASMMKIYSNGRICSLTEEGAENCTVQWTLNPTLYGILAESRDYERLQYVWEEWRNVTSKMKPIYRQFVQLHNMGARQAGFNDTGDYWRAQYETWNFTQQIEALYLEVLPLYEKLHCFVRRRLKELYPGKFGGLSIPAHILGNMWSLEWKNLFPVLKPFKNVSSSIDVSGAMRAKNMTALDIFRLADKHFISMGLLPAPEEFWNKSIITKPKRPFVCHASAWDFCNGKDFRIKMCTTVDMTNLVRVHHEMGHIQHYLQYRHHHISFRRHPNPGISEAIGDSIALAIVTPKHLQDIGFLSDYKESYDQDINYLLRQGLDKIAFLPYAYTMDLWRWRVFAGETPYAEWNNDWWNLRWKLQGLVAPNPRPADAFDPGAKSHIGSNTPYIRYFISFIVQFQLYKAMCDAAGYKGPLHQCDFAGNRDAGRVLGEMMAMGSSEPWPEAMRKSTGQPEMRAHAFKEYFKPLAQWLEKENSAAGDCYGWGADDEWTPEVLATLPQPRCSFAAALHRSTSFAASDQHSSTLYAFYLLLFLRLFS